MTHLNKTSDKQGTHTRPEFLPNGAHVGKNDQMLAILQDYVNKGSDSRVVAGYAVAVNDKHNSDYITGAEVILYYWTKDGADRGDYSITNAGHALGRLADHKSTWSD